MKFPQADPTLTTKIKGVGEPFGLGAQLFAHREKIEIESTNGLSTD